MQQQTRAIAQPTAMTARETRRYILDMASELARLAKGVGEAELAIYLRAIVDGGRLSDRERPR